MGLLSSASFSLPSGSCLQAHHTHCCCQRHLHSPAERTLARLLQFHSESGSPVQTAQYAVLSFVLDLSFSPLCFLCYFLSACLCLVSLNRLICLIDVTAQLKHPDQTYSESHQANI